MHEHHPTLVGGLPRTHRSPGRKAELPRPDGLDEHAASGEQSTADRDIQPGGTDGGNEMIVYLRNNQ